MHAAGLVPLLIWNAVCFVASDATFGDTGARAVPNTPGLTASDAEDGRAQLVQLLGPDKRLRDFAPLTTERGERAFLLLFVTAPIAEPSVGEKLRPQPRSCPEDAEGIALGGIYHVGLVIGDKLVNEVQLPGTSAWSPRSTLDFPVRNTRFNNYVDWGQGSPIAYDDPSAEVVEPTKLIQLVDYNGDGHAWEFRLVQNEGGCGATVALSAGYSAKQRRAILYPVIVGAERLYWYPHLFPAPSPALSTKGKLHYEVNCFDHGNDTHVEQWFQYDRKAEAWTRKKSVQHPCD